MFRSRWDQALQALVIALSGSSWRSIPLAFDFLPDHRHHLYSTLRIGLAASARLLAAHRVELDLARSIAVTVLPLRRPSSDRNIVMRYPTTIERAPELGVLERDLVLYCGP